MYRVYSASNLQEAHIILHMLHEAHVDAEVFNQNSAGALGELPETFPEVWVRHEKDVDRAREILAEYEAASRVARAQRRQCDGCGESNPGTFEICWQCGENL